MRFYLENFKGRIMTMRVVFLQEYGDHEAGWEGFIPRQLGRRLCQQEITIPDFGKETNSAYNALLKKKADEKADADEKARKKAEQKAEREAKKKIKALKKKATTKRKTAVSKKTKTREKSIIGA
jgi:hypothetical protein